MAKLGKSSQKYSSNHQSEEVVNKLNTLMDKFGVVHNAIRDLDDDPDPIRMVPTGTLILDHHLRGGIPPRSICELFGDSQGGKSWLAQKLMARVTQRYQQSLFIDVEVGFNPFRAQEIGVLLSYVTLFDSYEKGTQVLEMVSGLISSVNSKVDPPFIEPQPFELYVIDSIAVLPSDQQIKGEGSIGDRARMISKWQREILPSLSRSVGTWKGTYHDNLRWGMNTIPISQSGLGEKLWKQMGDMAKKRKKVGIALDHYDPEVQESVGNIPVELAAFEVENGLKVMDIADGDMAFQKYCDGPIIVVVNQVRFTDFGNYTGPRKTVTGGGAALYMATTRINIEPVGGKAGKIINETTGELEYYLSRAKIVKSRFAKQVIDGIEIRIPAGETDKDEWDEFLALLAARELYWYGRGYHHVPKPSENLEAFIKTKDNVEFLQEMVGGGMDFCTEELGWTVEQMAPYVELCKAKISGYIGSDMVDVSENTDEDVEIDTEEEEEES